MTREQILSVAKPILFNIEMVQALLNDRKHVTRRLMKGKALEHELDTDGSIIGVYDQKEGYVKPILDYAPYQPGDLLYVQETWGIVSSYPPEPGYDVAFKANSQILHCPFSPERWVKFSKFSGKSSWQSPYFLPKEAARIFLQVQNVWPERLQDITEEQAKAEGANWKNGKNVGWEEKTQRSAIDRFADIWNACYASPRAAVKNGVITHYESYPWEDIHETRTYKGLPWHVRGNPWVWATEFERIEIS